MTDLRTLTDAFSELERRADVVTAERAAQPIRRAPRRLVPVAATVAVVTGLAAGAVWLVPGDNAGTSTGTTPTTSTSTTSTSTSTSTSRSSTGLPQTPEELIDRLTTVLGGTATFTVTERGPGAYQMTVPPGPDNGPLPTSEDSATSIGASIVGAMTAGGLTGGFDLVVFPGSGTRHPSECGACTRTTLPDGAELDVTVMTLEAPGGLTYGVDLVRTNGDTISMHVSNNSAPKGNGDVIAPRPPLTTDQMIAIVTSELW
jgi:hypothetical protein